MTANIGFKDDFDSFDIDDEFATASAFDNLKPAPGMVDPYAVPEGDRFVEPVAAPATSAMPPATNPVGALMAGVESALGEASVPRISIDIFCQRSETAAVAQKAAADRRLSRAHDRSAARRSGRGA